MYGAWTGVYVVTGIHDYMDTVYGYMDTVVVPSTMMQLQVPCKACECPAGAWPRPILPGLHPFLLLLREWS